MHNYVIKWLMENKQDVNAYDFLAGDARYKRSLSNAEDNYSLVLIQKKRLKFTIENALKALMKKVNSIFK